MLARLNKEAYFLTATIIIWIFSWIHANPLWRGRAFTCLDIEHITWSIIRTVNGLFKSTAVIIFLLEGHCRIKMQSNTIKLMWFLFLKWLSPVAPTSQCISIFSQWKTISFLSHFSPDTWCSWCVCAPDSLFIVTYCRDRCLSNPAIAAGLASPRIGASRNSTFVFCDVGFLHCDRTLRTKGRVEKNK